MNYLSRFIIIVYSLLLMSSAHAVLRVEITRGVDSAAPIAIIPFEKSGLALPVSQDVSAIIAADLQRSGRFAPIDEGKLIAAPQSLEAVNYKLWRIASIDHIVIGQVKVLTAGQYELQFRLVDIFRGEQVLGYKFNADDSNLRGMSHHISDLIYQHITGQRGAFDTKVAYITAERAAGKQPVYKLQVADTDGYNPQTVLTSTQPIMSPSWSPDGTRLAYVSFESGLSAIFIQNLLNRQRQKIASFEGINGAPAWSPDGTKLAMTLSKSGNPDIYIMDLRSQKLQQLTTHWGIDTEPAWMPDGSEIIFTSSRSGKPQLYRKPLQNGRAKRITFEGDYNANAEVAPDGRSVAYVQGTGNVFKIALLDLQTGFVNLLTDGALDESPSFAPNGGMILYATQAGRRGVLAAVSADGRFKQRLVLTEGDVREPSWAPFKKN